MGVDGILHWEGKPVVVKRGVELTTWQTVLAAVTAFSALTVALVSALSFFGLTFASCS